MWQTLTSEEKEKVKSIITRVGINKIYCHNFSNRVITLLRIYGLKAYLYKFDGTSIENKDYLVFNDIWQQKQIDKILKLLSSKNLKVNLILFFLKDTDEKKIQGWLNDFSKIGYIKHPLFYYFDDYNSNSKIIFLVNDLNHKDNTDGIEYLKSRDLSISPLIVLKKYILPKSKVGLYVSTPEVKSIINRISVDSKFFEITNNHLYNVENSPENLGCDLIYISDLKSPIELLKFKDFIKPGGRIIVVLNYTNDPLQKDVHPSIYLKISDELILDELWASCVDNMFLKFIKVDNNSLYHFCYHNHLVVLDFLYIPKLISKSSNYNLRGYTNEWVEKSMLDSGSRFKDLQVLKKHSHMILKNADVNSVEFAASLCVYLYRIIEEEMIFFNEYESIKEFVSDFFHIENTELKYMRWKISLTFVAALLSLKLDKSKDAQAFLLMCVSVNPQDVLPMIATKTLSAFIILANIEIGENNYFSAQEYLKQGLSIAMSVIGTKWDYVVGDDLSTPKEFGLNELSQIAELAYKCSCGINSIKDGKTFHGIIFSRMNII